MKRTQNSEPARGGGTLGRKRVGDGGRPLAMEAARLVGGAHLPPTGPKAGAWGKAARAEVTLPAGERRFS